MTEQKSRINNRKLDKEPINVSETLKDEKPKRKERGKRKPRIRLIPIWLRLLLAIVLIGGSLLLGLIVGYGVIGDGAPADALKQETWYHIIDIIRGR